MKDKKEVNTINKKNYDVMDTKKAFEEFGDLKDHSVFNKALNKDVPLSIAPSSLRGVIRDMDGDDEQMNKNIYSLAKNVLFLWDEFHLVFWKLLEDKIESKSDLMGLSEFSNELIISLQLNGNFYKFHKFIKINKGAHVIPEIDGNNLGVSWSIPRGKGSNYISHVLYEIYSDISRSSLGEKNFDKWKDNKNKISELLELDINKILYNSGSISDKVSDLIFFLGERYFKEFTENILKEISIDKKKASYWFKLSNNQKKDYDLSYLYPNSFLRSKNYYNYFKFDQKEINLSSEYPAFSNTEELREIIKPFNIDNFILKFSKVANPEDERKSVANANAEEIKWLNKIENILSKDYFGIKNLIHDDIFLGIIDIINIRSRDFCKDKILLSENDITRKIFDKIPINEFRSMKRESGDEAGADYRVDLTYDYSRIDKLSIFSNEMESKRQKYKIIISDAIKQENIEVANEIRSEELWSNTNGNLKSAMKTLDKEKFLVEKKPLIITECKVLDKTQFKKIVNSDFHLQKGQMISYEKKIKSLQENHNREVKVVGISYINSFLIDEMCEEKIKEVEEKNKGLPDENKFDKHVFITNNPILSALRSTNYYIDREKNMLYLSIDCEYAHLKNT